MLRLALVFCAAAGTWGCGSASSHAVDAASSHAVDAASSHAVAAKDYPQSCADVIDCAPITEGVIGCCGLEACPNAAIRADAVARYMSDLDARTPHCIPAPPCLALPPCAGGRIACTNGVCELLEPSQGQTTDGATN
ncbi:MAG TPA: hypothetical protein VLA14_03055 [Polyangia bacterium]|nr:hypothetical protein [Polyangia bacterium]